MSVFDPASMLAPLQARGDALGGATDAPAVLVAAYRDGIAAFRTRARGKS